MHEAAFNFVKAALERYERTPDRVLEIGGRDINGSVRPLFHEAETYHAIDISPGPGVDVVADGSVYVPPFMPDCVVCCEVLEHTSRAEAIVRHALRMVGPGGILIVTAAGPKRAPHSAVDGAEPKAWEFYRNITPDALSNWLSDPSVHVASRYVLESDKGDDVYAFVIVEDANEDRLH